MTIAFKTYIGSIWTLSEGFSIVWSDIILNLRIQDIVTISVNVYNFYPIRFQLIALSLLSENAQKLQSFPINNIRLAYSSIVKKVCMSPTIVIEPNTGNTHRRVSALRTLSLTHLYLLINLGSTAQKRIFPTPPSYPSQRLAGERTNTFD